VFLCVLWGVFFVFGFVGTFCSFFFLIFFFGLVVLVGVLGLLFLWFVCVWFVGFLVLASYLSFHKLILIFTCGVLSIPSLL